MIREIDRRVFIRDFGRGVLGISIGGVVLAACSGDDLAVSSIVASSTTQPADSKEAEATEPTQPIAIDAGPELVVGPVAVSRVVLGSVSAYVLVRGSEAAIVDTGNGGSAGEIEQALSEVGLTWGSVGTVILTHRHSDHIGSLSEMRPLASEAVYGAGQGDVSQIGGGRDLVPFADGQEVFGSTIVAVPGHTEGSIAVWDELTRVLIAGDALNGGGDLGVLGANPAFTPDMSTANVSAAKLAALKPDSIYFGHGEPLLEGAEQALDELVANL